MVDASIDEHGNKVSAFAKKCYDVEDLAVLNTAADVS
jgi:hypothetical protein